MKSENWRIEMLIRVRFNRPLKSEGLIFPASSDSTWAGELCRSVRPPENRSRTFNRRVGDRYESGLMRAEDALRKIGLLRRMKTENGALAAEADNAARLAKALMERYAIKAEDIPPASRQPAFRMTWIYWQELLKEFGFQLRHFGRRGSAAIGEDKIVYIKLDAAQWWIEGAVGRRLANHRSRLGRRISAQILRRTCKGLLSFQALTPERCAQADACAPRFA
jgi:hypothetical protein